MKIWLAFSFVFILLTVQEANSLIINEIYPKSPEWIELYNAENEEINISEWQIKDNVEADKITCYTIQNCSTVTTEKYILIIGRSTNISDIKNESVKYFYVDDSRIGNSINDDGDDLTLFNGSFNNTFSFNFSLESKSWGRFPDGSEHLFLMNSSPGKSNLIENTTGENQNETNNTCDLRLWIECNEIFTPESHGYYLMTENVYGGKFEPEVEYWIEDMFGGVVRSREKTNNTGTNRSWKPPDMTGTEAYVIHANITFEPCNDMNVSNNYIEKIIVSKGRPRIPDSEIKIIDIDVGSDGKAKFGDTVEARIDAYKGDTAKSSIYVWIENSAGNKIAKSSFNMYSKFTNYSLAIPLQISPNCDGDFPSGIYTAKAEGIDSYDEIEIVVNGNSTSLCKTKTVEISKPCSCPSSQACKCDNKSLGAIIKETLNKTLEKNKTHEFDSFLNKTNLTKVLGNISTFKNNSTRNESKETGEIKLPTGKIVSKSEENWFSSAVNGIINFFKNLFKL